MGLLRRSSFVKLLGSYPAPEVAAAGSLPADSPAAEGLGTS